MFGSKSNHKGGRRVRKLSKHDYLICAYMDDPLKESCLVRKIKFISDQNTNYFLFCNLQPRQLMLPSQRPTPT